MIAWRGWNRQGDGCTGQIFDYDQLRQFVEAKYRARWRRLVAIDQITGDQVAAIERNPSTGRRVWWVNAP